MCQMTVPALSDQPPCSTMADRWRDRAGSAALVPPLEARGPPQFAGPRQRTGTSDSACDTQKPSTGQLLVTFPLRWERTGGHSPRSPLRFSVVLVLKTASVVRSSVVRVRRRVRLWQSRHDLGQGLAYGTRPFFVGARVDPRVTASPPSFALSSTSSPTRYCYHTDALSTTLRSRQHITRERDRMASAASTEPRAGCPPPPPQPPPNAKTAQHEEGALVRARCVRGANFGYIWGPSR